MRNKLLSALGIVLIFSFCSTKSVLSKGWLRTRRDQMLGKVPAKKTADEASLPPKPDREAPKPPPEAPALPQKAQTIEAIKSPKESQTASIQKIKAAVKEVSASPKSIVKTYKTIKQEVGNLVKAQFNKIFPTKPKTLEQQLKEQKVRMLFAKEMGIKESEIGRTKSIADNAFMQIGLAVMTKFPDASAKLIQASLKARSKESGIKRVSARAYQRSMRMSDTIRRSTGVTKSLVSDKDIEAELQARRNEELKKFEQQLADENADLVKEGKPPHSEAEMEQLRSTFKKDLASSISKESIRWEMEESKAKELALKKITDLASKDPQKYIKELAKIGKKMGMTPEQVKAALKPVEPGKSPADAATRNQIMYEAYLNNLQQRVRSNWIDDMHSYATTTRERTQSAKVVVGAVVVGVLVNSIIAAIQNGVVNDINASAKEDQARRDAKKENLDADYLKLQQERSRLALNASQEQTNIAKSSKAAQDADAKAKADLLDGIAKTVDFYLTFADIFRNALTGLDYYDTVLNASANVTYSGGILNAGIVLMFESSGAGNIADGLTPVNTKVYPTKIGKNTILFDSILGAMNDALSLELASALSGCYPEPVFLIKAISLLNTANKKFTDVDQRNEFLDDELKKLFIRLIWTVDEKATYMANAMETNEDKWESVYIKDASKCIFTAPAVLRDMLKDNEVVGVKNDDGTISNVAYDQYIVDKFEDFKVLKNIPFEGDVDFEDEHEGFDKTDAKLVIFSILLRGFNDILKLEKELVHKTDPVVIKNERGKEESFVGKTAYEDATNLAWKKLLQVQDKFIANVVDLGFDSENTDLLKTHQACENELLAAANAYDKAVLTFRKKVCLYVFDRTQGIEPETVLDFIKREMKRYYTVAINKVAFEEDLIKIFEPFAPNFPFTAEDIMNYAKDPSPIKHPQTKDFAQDSTPTQQLKAEPKEQTQSVQEQKASTMEEEELAVDKPIELQEQVAVSDEK